MKKKEIYELDYVDLKIDRKILLNALANIKPIVSGRHTLAILSSILISAKENMIEIFATNLETGFHGIYPAKVIAPGEIAIPHKELSAFISKLKSEEICISEEEKYYVKVSDNSTNNSTTRNVHCMSAEDFPLLPEEITCKKEIEIDAIDFKDMLAKTVLINPQNETDSRKMYITGMSFKTIKEGKQDFLQAVSTNGGILAQVNAKISTSKQAEIKDKILVSKSELIKLSRAFLKNIKPQKIKRKNKGFELFESSSEQAVSLAVQGGFFIAQKQNETITISLLEGDFPNYQDIINRGENKFVITANREILLDAMRQMAAMQDDNYRKMQMNIEKNILKMAFTNPDTGEMKKDISVQYNGDNIETLYSPSQFVDFLSLMKSDIVNLDIIDNKTPCLITGAQDKETIFVIMPWPMD